MNLLISSILISVFIIFYYLMIKVFVILFKITGLTIEKAHFQVISLLTNSGFTTGESELITNNRSRRKIAKIAMITGMIFNVFIASLLINVLINISVNDKIENLKIIGIVAGCLVALLIAIKIPFISKAIDKGIEKIANKIRNRKHHENVIIELDAYDGETISEVYINKMPDLLMNKNIESSGLKSEYNILVLLCKRKGKVLDITLDLTFKEGDKIIVFGKASNIKDVFEIGSDNVNENDNK